MTQSQQSDFSCQCESDIAATTSQCGYFHFPTRRRISKKSSLAPLRELSLSLLFCLSVSSVGNQVTRTKLPPRPPEKRLRTSFIIQERRRVKQEEWRRAAVWSPGSFVLDSQLRGPPPALHANGVEGQLTPTDPCNPHRPFTDRVYLRNWNYCPESDSALPDTESDAVNLMCIRISYLTHKNGA